jgi:transcriptional regulator with XRE-family HTH domain
MNKKQVAAKLVKLRKDAGMTQDELAECAGISQGHISYLEKTGELSSLEHIRNLAAAYNMEPSALMDLLLKTK